MGKKVKIGNDRQPAPIITENVPLYNLSTGQKLTDEGGTPLVSAEDTFLTSEATSAKATSLVYTDDKKYKEFKNTLLTGENFSAVGNQITAASGTGLFKGETKYKIIFSSSNTITQLSIGIIVTNTRTGATGEVISFTLNADNLTGNLIIDGYESTLFVGDEFEFGSPTETFSLLETKFVGKLPEVSGGDRLLLPTGLQFFESEFVTYDVNSTYSVDTVVRSGTDYYHVQEAVTASDLPTVITNKYKFVKISPIGSAVSGKYLTVSVIGNIIRYSSKIYEQRTVKQVIDNDTIELSLSVTSNNPVFTDLILVNIATVDPTLKIEEQFATFSEVSTTILGYPKAEEQLGLFSNVSTYGLDEDEFIFYSADASISTPSIWATRKNKTYGNHYNSRAREIKDEAAIALESYRTPYSYPFSNSTGVSTTEAFVKFNTFLKLGIILYDYYKDTNPSYANNFLPYIPNHALTAFVGSDAPGAGATEDSQGEYINYFVAGETIRVNNSSNEVIGTVKSFNMDTLVMHFNEDIGFLLRDRSIVELPLIGEISGTTITVVSDLTYKENNLFFTSFLTPVNSYYSSSADLFAQIDTWTETYRKILKGDISRPNGSPLDSIFIQNLPDVQYYLIGIQGLQGTIASNDLTRPGYSTAIPSRAYLESRKAFRYQPGRISGFTFGVRASNDARDDNNVVTEWGIGNDTDDLVFQIRGSSFAIVRRSVVPLSDDILASNNLEPEDQVLITKDTRNNTVFNGIENKQVYETVITRDRWNGDKLDGNGPSNYLWRAENVTMYKIEFGWYGAIGVQFYAYVPVENGEARWVKLHRLIIENKLSQPCMGDPYFKFKYSLIVNDYINVKTPQYIYKYGTSCYIDGGDEGTLRVYSSTAEEKTAPIQIGDAQLSTSLVALQPKNVIYNSLGEAIKNKKQVFPKELSVLSSGLTEVSIVKCKSCPGFGYTYQPNLDAGYSGDSRQFSFPFSAGGSDRTQLELVLQTRSVVSSGGIGQYNITLDNVNYLRVGDIVDINQQYSSIIDVETLIDSIDTVNNVITLNKPLIGSFVGGEDLEIQPVFLKQDLFSKIIAFRFFVTYVWKFDPTSLRSFIGQDERYTRIVLGTIDTAAVSGTQDQRLEEYLIEREIPRRYRSGDELFSIPSIFYGRLSAYKAVAASTASVIGRKNSLLFFGRNNYDGGSFSNGQIADYRVGVTSLRPSDDGSGGITWLDESGIPREFTDDYKLYAERFSEGIAIDEDGYEYGEGYSGRVQPFVIDYRIPPPIGTNSGRCCFLDITVDDAQFVQVTQFRGDQLPLGDITDPNNGGYTAFNQQKYYVRTGGIFPFTFDPQNAEVGFNENDPNSSLNPPTVGSGVRFTSDVITYIESGTGAQYQLLELSSNLPGQTDPNGTSVVIWYVPISLETYRKLATKAFKFNPYPLYFFVELRDGAALYGAVIKEQGQFLNTYNPRWLTTESMSVTNSNIEVGPIGNTVLTTGSLTQSPPNFVDRERLSSALVDTQNQAQLRPYEVVDKIYVGQDTKSISLDAIFARDKETITPDLLNTTAYFFIATSKETDPNNPRSIQATLTYVEQ